MLTILPGYLSDGATGVLDTIDGALAFLIHDALYTIKDKSPKCLPRSGVLDNVYRKVLIAQDCSRFRANYHYVGLRVFGHRGWLFGWTNLFRRHRR